MKWLYLILVSVLRSVVCNGLSTTSSMATTCDESFRKRFFFRVMFVVFKILV